jgi:hypothetical protein
MNTNHKPATALPWKVNPGNTFVAVHGAKATIYVDANPEIRREEKLNNAAYITHSSNAYPRLVCRNQDTLAALAKTDNALQAMGHYALGKILREEISATQALLHELGEL